MAVDKCLKYLLFLFNLLFCMSGCFILGVSIYLKVSSVTGFMGTVPGVGLLIGAGVIITVLGFLGCCGALKENRVLLMLFFVMLLLLFILLMAAVTLGAVGVSEAKESMREWIEAKIPLRNQTSQFQAKLQKLEEQAKCCGLINGPSDWGSTVPDSCQCDNTTQECQLADGRQVYVEPCVKVLVIEMVKKALIVLAIAFVIAVLIVFGMTLSMTLYCQTRKTDDYIAH